MRVGAPILVADQVMSELAFATDETPARLRHYQRQGVEPLQSGPWRPLSATVVDELRDTAAA